MSETARKMELLDRLLTEQSWPEPRVSRVRQAFRDGTDLEGLTAQAWHEPQACPWLAPLRENYVAIREELLACQENGRFTPTAEDGEHGALADWALLHFFMKRVLYEENLNDCPQVARYLDHLRSQYPTAGLWASLMEAGVELPRHRGADNTVVRAHFGILIPDECVLSVNGEDRHFIEGEALVFEPSFEHTAWNKDPQGRPRLVLSIDIWHPDLTMHEVAAFQFIERMGTEAGVEL